jgi:heptosyltransferase III
MTYGNYPQFAEVNKVLIIKFRHLGDVLLSTPLFSILSQRYPHLSIDALVYKEAVCLLQHHHALRKVYEYDREIKKLSFFKRLRKELSLLMALKKNRYDMIINLTEGDRGGIIARFCNPKYRVGKNFTKGFCKKNAYTHLVKECKMPRHQVELDLDFLRAMGVFPQDQEKNLYLSVDDSPFREYQDYMIFCPFSRWKYKCLPVNKMRQIIRYMVEKGQKICLCGGNDSIEKNLAKTLQKGFSEDQIKDFVGKLDLLSFVSLIKAGKGVICVDSLALHICSVFKKKVITFFGPSSEIKWGPWQNPNAFVITEPFSCRPCCMDGCGGSKQSDCLVQMDLHKVYPILDRWIKEKSWLPSNAL